MAMQPVGHASASHARYEFVQGGAGTGQHQVSAEPSLFLSWWTISLTLPLRLSAT